MLQCVAVGCGACNVLQCVATVQDSGYRRGLTRKIRVAVRCSVLQCVAVCCSVLQLLRRGAPEKINAQVCRVAVCCSIL